jgi:spore germination protein
LDEAAAILRQPKAGEADALMGWGFMLSCNERITLRQMQVLLVLGSLGTGMIVLPRRVAEYAAQDGWMIVIGLTMLAMGFGALVTAAARTRPGQSFMGYAGYAVSRPVAYLFGAMLWIKLVLSAGLELRSFLVISRQVLLPSTPVPLVSAVMLTVCAYAASKGIEARARVGEILIIVLALPLAFLFVIALLDIDPSHLQPVFTTPPQRLLTGTLKLGFIFTGLECLLLASPHIAPEKKMGRAVVSAIGLAGLVITVITAITLAKFGSGVMDEPWPVLRLMDRLKLPGSFIERQEALVFSFWIVSAFALVNALVFYGGSLLGDMFRKKHGNRSPVSPAFVLATAVAVFGVTCMPWEGEGIYRRLDWAYYTGGTFFLFVFPLLLLTGAGLRKLVGSWRRVMTGNAKALLLLVIFAAPLFAFTGCYDRVEIENRAFVVSMGLDKAEEGYTLTVTTALAQNGKGENDDKEEMKTRNVSAKTLTEAFHELDAKTGKRLYYGQAKLIVLGDALLADAEKMKNVMSKLSRHPEIDRRIHVLATQGKASEILEAHAPDETVLCLDKRETTGGMHSINLIALSGQLSRKSTALVPAVKKDKDELRPDGAVAIKDYAKAETLSQEELRGYLWAFSGKNENVVVTAGTRPVPFTVERHTADIRFLPSYPAPRAVIEIHTEGRIDENPVYSSEIMKLLIAGAINDEIMETAKKLQAQGLDAYHWRERLRKSSYSLYQRHGHRWTEAFPEIIIEPRVTVHVKS